MIILKNLRTPKSANDHAVLHIVYARLKLQPTEEGLQLIWNSQAIT